MQNKAANFEQSLMDFDVFCQMELCKLSILQAWKQCVCGSLSIAHETEQGLLGLIGESALHSRVWELCREWHIDPYHLTVDYQKVQGFSPDLTFLCKRPQSPASPCAA